MAARLLLGNKINSKSDFGGLFSFKQKVEKSGITVLKADSSRSCSTQDNGRGAHGKRKAGHPLGEQESQIVELRLRMS